MARLDACPVWVEWKDAHAGGANWMSVDDIDHDPCIVWTLGFLIPNGKPGHLTIAQSLADSGDFDSPIFIPSDMVLRTVVMKNPPQANT
jgi:hypothetical protein